MIDVQKELQLESNSAEKLIEKYSLTVYRLALSQTGNKADAEDVMQEVFMRLIKRSPTFNDDEHPKAWLLKATVNAAKSFHTSVWRRQAVLMPAYEIKTCCELNYADYSKIHRAVFRLDVKKRTCIHLFYFEDLTVTQIAQTTGFKEPTVRSHLKRGREKLKLILGENDENDT